jgi:hypothetical protein
MRRALALVLVSLFTVPIQAQQSAPAQQLANSSPASTTEQAPASGCKQPCLEDGTPVKMRISQTVSSAEAPQVAKIKAQVRKRGAGENSKVRVTLGNGTMVKGYISKIDESSFEVQGNKTGQATLIAYTDVQKVQGPGLSTGEKVAIGVAIGVGVIAGIAVWAVRHRGPSGSF